ncbi:hypothetical protein QJQ45_013452 [Haematococcus lacustris]|nr:hypothetical protein QJQ45_013452 [Haematococcus lacustris]
MRVVVGCNAHNISNILYAMGLVLWHDKEVCRQLAERAAQLQRAANGQDLANNLYALARLGYLDSSVRSLAAKVAEADLTAFEPQHLANLLYARSMFLALSIHQAVSAGHSQLASEPQLNSMAAALWRECSRRGQGIELGLPRGIAVDQISLTLHDGSMSGVAAHIKLQQMTHFDARVMVNKAVFNQLRSDGERAAFMSEQRWLALIKPHLQHLAAASSAGTSLEANLKHITVTLATWDAVWEVYLDPKWARQRLRLYGAQDRALEQFFKKLEEDMAEVSMEHHGRAKQLVVFFGAAGIGIGGGWGADAVLRACCKVVCRPRGIDQLRGRVVLVNEHRTSRVSSAVNGKQPCEEELDHEQPTRRAGWKPPAGQVEHRLLRPARSQQRDQPVRSLMWCTVVAPHKPPQAPCSNQAATQPAASEPGPNTPLPAKRSKRTEAEQAAEPTQPTQPTKGKGKAAKAKPAPLPGRWIDRDCNAALNMQRIGESRWCPLELCYWPDQGALPAKGKEYPGLGYKRLRDKPPKAQQPPPPI